MVVRVDKIDIGMNITEEQKTMKVGSGLCNFSYKANAHALLATEVKLEEYESKQRCYDTA
jgi:hypothetical protein